jgi:hypothetical protein
MKFDNKLIEELALNAISKTNRKETALGLQEENRRE